MLPAIHAGLSALSVAERRVAEYLLAHPHQFVSLPVTELARRSGVSKPTVVRFCRSVGHAGLIDFKRALAAALNEESPFAHRAVDAGDTAGDVAVKVIDNTAGALLQYRSQVVPRAFERAIEVLAKAGAAGGRIEFYGMGISGIVAQDARHQFLHLGVKAEAISDSHMQVMSATMLGPGDCVVIISRAGRREALLDAARIAREKGATLVLITASGSRLAGMATGSQHILLPADHPWSSDRYSPVPARMLHLVIIDILVSGVALRMPVSPWRR